MYFALVLALAVGSVQGVVTAGDSALPGCTVTLQSPAGNRAAFTDVEGKYRFDSVAPGSYELRFELSGLKPVQRSIEVVEGLNEQPAAELAFDEHETITLSCGISLCQERAPASLWELPSCSDYALNDALIAAMGHGDRSAAALLRSRYAQAATYAEKHMLAGALLRKVPNDSVYWNELFEHAGNAVRFSVGGTDHSDEFVQWCQERLYEPGDYSSMTLGAFDRVSGDPRSRALLLEAIERADSYLAALAVAGLGAQRDTSALPAIERALQRYSEAGDEGVPYIALSLAAYANEQADQLAFRYLTAAEREEYLEARSPAPQE